MKEIWKNIKNYEGYYEISSQGNVRNSKTGKILIGDKNNAGYKRVTLYSPIKKRFFIHRLVAQHFCEGYQEDLVVNHKDGNKLNNCANNLEWVTRSENDLHAFKNNLRQAHPCTFKHKIGVYTSNGTLFKVYQNVQECQDDLKVTRSNIYNCCNGKQKVCRGFILKYID